VTTGTYKLKSIFNNEDNALFPNQFVNVHLLVDTKRNLIIVPAAAIQRGPQELTSTPPATTTPREFTPSPSRRPPATASV